MEIVVEITDSEYDYLQKLSKNGDQLGHYERILAGGIPIKYKPVIQEQTGEVKIINNMRRNNPLDMTIEEQLEKVKEDCCDKICKQLEKANRGEILTDELDSICEECPLRRL